MIKSHSTKVAVIMFSILLLSYIINAMDRQLFSILATDVRNSLDLDLPKIGLASTIFTLGMGVAGIPTALLLTRMSRKNVVILGIILFSAATFMTAYAKGFSDLLLYRFLSGLGEAMQLTALLAIGTTYFIRHRAVAASSLNFTFGIGAIIGPIFGAFILNQFHWQMPFIVFGLAGIPMLVLILLFTRAWLTEAKPTEQQIQIEANNTDSAQSILSRKPILLAIATAFAGLSIYGYLGLYPTFLRESLGFHAQDAAKIVSFYGLGALLSLFGGWLGDKYNYNKVLFFFLIISAISGGLVFTPLNHSLWLHALFSFVFGGAISGMVYSNLSAGLIKSVVSNKASQASGLFVASLYIPAAFAGYILGQLKDHFGWSYSGIIQISGCAIISAILIIIATLPVKYRK
ncbi:sugar phosphate permease [Orbus hercynius]|uniref:Sugar phosphate permease n=1 Tax=Orbus hercynius TaxID=593135 RepID=A0A495RBL9_9GAMM|nr:MFS transporter [Orbus hercynius]RKS84805.1 sugar phosphate permease [Orbus hercynius]